MRTQSDCCVGQHHVGDSAGVSAAAQVLLCSCAGDCPGSSHSAPPAHALYTSSFLPSCRIITHQQDKMHGVVRFDPKTGVQQKGKPKTGSYTNYFADALIAEAERDNRIVAIHAAMAGGTGAQKELPPVSSLSMHLCCPARARVVWQACGRHAVVLDRERQQAKCGCSRQVCADWRVCCAVLCRALQACTALRSASRSASLMWALLSSTRSLLRQAWRVRA